MPPERSYWHYAMGGLIFVAFVGFVETYLGWTNLLQPWRELSLLTVLGAGAVVFVSYAVRALRLYDYFRVEMAGAYGLCLRLFLQHNMLNNLLPMRSGELSFPWLMSRYFSIQPIRSLPTLLWFRLLDLHTLIAIALTVTLFKSLDFFLGAGLLLWASVPYLGYRLSGRLQRIIAKRTRGRLWRLVLRLLESLPQSPRDFWASWLWTVLNWLVKLAAFAWVLLFFIDISLAAACLGVIAGDLTSVLPIHGVAGVGTYEAGVVGGLLPFGVDTGQALPAAINLHLFLLGVAVLGGLLSILLPRRPKKSA